MTLTVKPIAFDSFGVRSMATYVRTDDVEVVIDPGVSLAPSRYGLPPHRIEVERMYRLWEAIKSYANAADILILTHYHYDHHDPTEPEIYRDKVVYIKHPTEFINISQRNRAAFFLQAVKDLPERLEYSDGKTFCYGDTTIKFSKPVCHGANPRLGYVTEVSISCGGEKLVFTSDVEGPSLPDQALFILDEKPDILILDGPMTYMLGFRYSFKSLQASILNLIRVMEETSVKIIVPEHHFMRDLQYRARLAQVYKVADQRGIQVITAAEFLGRPIELLEARRKELYEGEYAPGAIEKELE